MCDELGELERASTSASRTLAVALAGSRVTRVVHEPVHHMGTKERLKHAIFVARDVKRQVLRENWKKC